jgi:hypothetical protein
MEPNSSLTLFDRINIANCAAQRAIQHVTNEEVFNAEYRTARMWSKYKCYITKSVSFVETD